MIRATIDPLHEPDYDASPLDFLPRDYSADLGEYTAEQIAEWEASDAEYIASWKRDDWRYIGIMARATVTAEIDGHPFTAIRTSPGLWSVEDNSDPAYIDEIEHEQRDELIALLQDEFPGIVID